MMPDSHPGLADNQFSTPLPTPALTAPAFRRPPTDS
jgi:hypothetical protein